MTSLPDPPEIPVPVSSSLLVVFATHTRRPRGQGSDHGVSVIHGPGGPDRPVDFRGPSVCRTGGTDSLTVRVPPGKGRRGPRGRRRLAGGRGSRGRVAGVLGRPGPRGPVNPTVSSVPQSGATVSESLVREGPLGDVVGPGVRGGGLATLLTSETEGVETW